MNFPSLLYCNMPLVLLKAFDKYFYSQKLFNGEAEKRLLGVVAQTFHLTVKVMYCNMPLVLLKAFDKYFYSQKLFNGEAEKRLLGAVAQTFHYLRLRNFVL